MSAEILKPLNRSAIKEIQSFLQPPPVLAMVMGAVMTVLERENSWAKAKQELNDPSFLGRLKAVQGLT